MTLDTDASWNREAVGQLQLREYVSVLNGFMGEATNRDASTSNCWMKAGINGLAVLVLVAALATGAMTCPLWMASMSQADMPCSKEHQSPQQCPISICQASSPYLADSITANAFPPQLFLAEVIDSTTISLSSITGFYEQCDNRSPPGVADRLFLKTRALLI